MFVGPRTTSPCWNLNPAMKVTFDFSVSLRLDRRRRWRSSSVTGGCDSLTFNTVVFNPIKSDAHYNLFGWFVQSAISSINRYVLAFANHTLEISLLSFFLIYSSIITHFSWWLTRKCLLRFWAPSTFERLAVCWRLGAMVIFLPKPIYFLCVPIPVFAR